MFTLELSHQGDSNEYIHHTIISIKKSPLIIQNIIMSAAMGFVFLETPERDRNSGGKRAISVSTVHSTDSRKDSDFPILYI